nr:MFS transporter [Kribbia dieselivorans]
MPSRNSAPTARISPWQMVAGLGLVSLFADMVADGGKALYGPLLGSLGASALIIGLVTGAAEATSLILRLVAGPLADAKGNHWSWTIAGYGLTALCIPLLAVTPAIGAAGVVVASTLIIVERVGKAFRSPSKSALLAQAKRAIGAGRGFGVHKALDMIGAVSGPLLVAAILAWKGQLWLAFAVLAVPGAITMGILLFLRHRVPDPSVFDPARHDAPAVTRRPSFLDLAVGRDLPRSFFVYALAAGLISGGLVAWGIVSFHLERAGMVPLAVIPLIFAGAMGVGPSSRLATDGRTTASGPECCSSSRCSPRWCRPWRSAIRSGWRWSALPRGERRPAFRIRRSRRSWRSWCRRRAWRVPMACSPRSRARRR